MKIKRRRWKNYKLFVTEEGTWEILQSFLSGLGERKLLKHESKRGCYLFQKGNAKYFVKVRRLNFWTFWQELWGKSWSLKVFENYLQFKTAGLETLMPLGGWVSILPFHNFVSGLIFRFLPWEYKAGFLCRHSKSRRQKVLELIIQYLRCMHEKGLAIKDPKLSNFFVVEDRVILIDLDSLRIFKGSVPFSWRQQNLKVLARSLEKLGWKDPFPWIERLYYQQIPIYGPKESTNVAGL